MLRALFYLFMLAFLGSLVLWLFWHVLAALHFVLWAAFWLGLLALIGYLAFSMLKPKLPQFGIKRAAQYKLFDTQKAHVYAFRLEPSLKDIALLHDELHIAKLELQGDVLPLENNTVIKILEDTGKEAVKVEIKGAKSKEKVLWVPRSAIVKADQSDGPKLLGS